MESENRKKILFVVSNIDEVGHLKTGVWLSKFAHPYLEFRNAGHDICVASPLGGEATLSPTSLAESHAEEHWRFAQDILKSTDKLAEVNEDLFDGLYLTGGPGVLFDLTYNEKLAIIVTKFYESGKMLAAIGHSVCGFVSAKLSNGEPFLKGKKVTCFTNSEEIALHKEQYVPFFIEDKVKELGAEFLSGPDFTEFVVVDNNILTGQSSPSIKKLTVEMLSFPVSSEK